MSAPSVFRAPDPVTWVPQEDGTERAETDYRVGVWTPRDGMTGLLEIYVRVHNHVDERKRYTFSGFHTLPERPQSLMPGEDGPYNGGAVDETDYRGVV